MVATASIGLATQICLGQTTRGARTQYTCSRRPPTLPACLILLAQLYHCIPQVLGHAAVAELLGLVDTPLISDAGLVLTPDPLEGIAQTQVRVALVASHGGDVAFEDRRLIFVAFDLVVLVRKRQETSRVVRVVRQHPLEILYPVLHARLSSCQLLSRSV